ncbi:putative sodium-coupled neutral amino acid transporter 10 isoform X3 [Lutra lutra]|uniref:putative sodium-coupled neutral amino acid transporter 10 isoform X3 n=1 Tax=Lutra lutra TaxID=9657 RepID=UPI001FD1A03A|nr:putative sodium-coupled neutral amino acid transporter 10 isoform X3 [Lutra lutra]
MGPVPTGPADATDKGRGPERLEKASLMPRVSPRAAESPGSRIRVAFPWGGKGWRSELRTSRKGLWGAPYLLQLQAPAGIGVCSRETLRRTETSTITFTAPLFLRANNGTALVPSAGASLEFLGRSTLLGITCVVLRRPFLPGPPWLCMPSAGTRPCKARLEGLDPRANRPEARDRGGTAEPVWHRPGGPAVGFLLLDDAPVLHVPGEVRQPEQTEDVRGPGQVLPTYDSLDEPSVKTMSSIFACSLNVVTAFYVTVGCFGYVSFTEATAGNVLMHFPSNLVTEMMRVGFMMSVAVGFPMMILPCRQALNTLLFEQQQKDGTFAAGGYMPPLRFKALTFSVVFGTMVGGIMIPNVETILGLTGAMMGSLICFVCPALIYKKIHKNTLSSQLVFWVGLGVLVVGTHTTLSVSEDAPVDLAEDAPAGRLEEAEGIVKAEAAWLPGTQRPGPNPVVDAASDGRDKPKLPNEKEEMEQAQIKGPVDAPQREGAKEKQEAAQLDRPGRGVAAPMGEAHRHEPPVPHDKVVVDEGEDREEPAENERPSKHVEEQAPGGNAQMALPLSDSERERPRQDQVLEVAGGLPEDPWKVPEGNGQPAIKPVEEDQGPGDRGLQPGPQAVPPKGQDAPAADAAERAGGVPLPGRAAGAAGKLADKSEPGGKAALPVKLAPEAGPQAEPQEQRDAEGQAGGKLEAEIKQIVAEAGRAEMLDHAVLLQVIKEQQVQQKRLLDQQEKLLAVIEEQHKEIHQQRQDGEDAEAQPEPGVPAPKGKEQETQEGQTVDRPSQQPVEPALGAPGRLPAPPQGHGQGALEEPKAEPEVAIGRAPAGPPGVADTEARVAQAEPREGQRGAVAQAAGAGMPERVPMPDPAEGPKSPEKPVAGELPEQDTFGRSSHERKKSRKEVAPTASAQEANVPGARENGNPHVRSQPVSRGRGPAGLSSRSGGAAPGAQTEIRQLEHRAVSVGTQGGQQGAHLEARKEAIAGDRVLALGEDTAVQKPERRQDPDPGPIPGAQKLDHAKANRDLKVQAGSDLRRRRRDVAPGAGGDPAPRDRVIISFNPLPDVQVNDLRRALETQLHQAAGGALWVVHGRQVKQLVGAPEEP